VASPPAETNTVTVVEAPAAPPLPDATTSEPKPPPVTRDTGSVEDIVPLIPEPSEGPEVPVAAGEIEYVVAAGDNFTNIASRHGVTVQAIIKANPAVDSNRMQIGQVLIIPAPAAKPPASSLPEGTVVYEVKPGDSLYAIAKEHKTTVKAIREVNDLSTSKIRPGQKLTIPSPETEN
jgi:LysM repeat protein